MDPEAQQATVHGVAESQTRLSDEHTHQRVECSKHRPHSITKFHCSLNE